jgi:hypothetical protein
MLYQLRGYEYLIAKDINFSDFFREAIFKFILISSQRAEKGLQINVLSSYIFALEDIKLIFELLA